MNIGFKISKGDIFKKITRPYYLLKAVNKNKVFCIGLNKTGTTSLKKAMMDLNFLVGDQRDAELLFDDWVKRDFRSLIKYCKTAAFFQDSPFSLPYTFIAMDQAYPGSKFILTVRDNPEQWYNSLINYHSKLWGNGNVPPTSEDLKNATYIYKGSAYHHRMHVHNVTDDEPYKKDVLLEYYVTHNKVVEDYFRFRQNNLLILNVSHKDAYKKLTNFLNVKTNKTEFPWENKTSKKQ